MAIIRVNKSKNYVVMTNFHFKEKEMSLKAKGLLSEMLSLPDDWDYSISGLASINKESEEVIKTTLDELKRFGYLKVTKLMPNETKTGRIEYIYDIYEQKQDSKKQGGEKQGVENQGTELSAQYNINNKDIKELNIKNKREINREKFQPPTLEQIEQYIKEKSLGIDAKQFYEYFTEMNWIDSKGNKVKNWKGKLLTWSGFKKNRGYKTFEERMKEAEEGFLNAIK